MPGYTYLACPSDQVDPSSGVCLVQPVTVTNPSILPPLSISDGAAISSAICAVWAVGFVIREIRRHMQRVT